MQMQNIFAGNRYQSYRSVMKTLLPKQQTWHRSKHVHRVERLLTLAQIDELCHELKWNTLTKCAHWAFHWPKYARI